MIGRPDGALVSGARRSAEAHGLPHERPLRADVRARFPALRRRRHGRGLGAAGRRVVSRGLHRRAPDARAAPAAPTCARRAGAGGLARRRRGRPRVTDRGGSTRRPVLFAAGSWLRALLPELGLPLTVERQVLYWFAPARPPASSPRRAARSTCGSREPGRFFYGFPDFGDGVKIARPPRGRRTADPDASRREVSDREVEALRARSAPLPPRRRRPAAPYGGVPLHEHARRALLDRPASRAPAGPDRQPLLRARLQVRERDRGAPGRRADRERGRVRPGAVPEEVADADPGVCHGLPDFPQPHEGAPRAGPRELRRPCSQLRSVATLTPIIIANSVWDLPRSSRIALTSAA